MNVTLGTPEIIYLVLNIIFLALAAYGTIRKGNTAGPFVFALFLWVFVTLPILYWGGFFS
jgi:hypothetical protein